MTQPHQISVREALKFSILFAMGAGLMGFVAWESHREEKARMAWVKTSATVDSYRFYKVFIRRGDGPKRLEGYEAKVLCKFKVGDRSYTHVRCISRDSREACKDRAAEVYPKGQTVALFFNPEKPQQSTHKKPEMGSAGTAAVVCFVLAAIFTCVFVYAKWGP